MAVIERTNIAWPDNSKVKFIEDMSKKNPFDTETGEL